MKEGSSIQEYHRLKGATVLDVEYDGERWQVVFALTDGSTLKGKLTQSEYDQMVMGAVPLVTDEEVS